MQQGYIPPKQQNDDERKRRVQRHIQTEKQSAKIQKKQRQTVRSLRLPIAITIFVLLVGVGGIISRNLGMSTTKTSDDANIRQNTQIQDTFVQMTAIVTSTPMRTIPSTIAPTATVKPYNTLSQGSHGDEVKQMQAKLIQLDYLNDDADGIFGKNTLNAVVSFQTQNDLSATGVADNETLVRLYSGYAKVYSPLQYSAGMYKIGYDIGPGEYIILANSSISAYFCLSNDSNGRDIIANDNFDYNSIITVKAGEYLEISRAKMMLLSGFVKHYSIPTNISGVMYKVGTNLKAGEYKLVSTSDYGGYYCIYESSRQDEIIANDNFENRTYVTVKRGQYLVLSRCKIP